MTDRPSQPRRATADMVASAAQVSRVAVSRAFNPHASILPEKRARILKVAGELELSPDRAARALATRRSHLVGVIVPDVCSTLGEPGDRRADQRAAGGGVRDAPVQDADRHADGRAAAGLCRGVQPGLGDRLRRERRARHAGAGAASARRRSMSVIPTTATGGRGRGRGLRPVERDAAHRHEQAVALAQRLRLPAAGVSRGRPAVAGEHRAGADAARGVEGAGSGGAGGGAGGFHLRNSGFLDGRAFPDAWRGGGDLRGQRRAALRGDPRAAVRAGAAGAGGRQGGGVRPHRPGALAELSSDDGAGGPGGAGAGAGVADPAAAEESGAPAIEETVQTRLVVRGTVG